MAHAAPQRDTNVAHTLARTHLRSSARLGVRVKEGRRPGAHRRRDAAAPWKTVAPSAHHRWCQLGDATLAWTHLRSSARLGVRPKGGAPWRGAPPAQFGFVLVAGGAHLAALS